jgi:hypothetical protein
LGTAIKAAMQHAMCMRFMRLTEGGGYEQPLRQVAITAITTVVMVIQVGCEGGGV